MAKRRTARRRSFAPRSRGGGRHNKRISLAVLAGFVPLAMEVHNAYKTEPDDFLNRAGHNVTAALTGFDTYDKKFHFGHMKNGALPILAGFMIHKFAGKLGINRAIASAGIPFVSV